MTINLSQENITPNPYDVLEVSPGASKKEITKAFALAMKKKKYNVNQIAEARKQLMDDKQRIIADYLRPILPTIQRLKKYDLSLLDEPIPLVELLPEFDGLEEADSDNVINSADRQLGAKLFSEVSCSEK